MLPSLYSLAEPLSPWLKILLHKKRRTTLFTCVYCGPCCHYAPYLQSPSLESETLLILSTDVYWRLMKIKVGWKQDFVIMSYPEKNAFLGVQLKRILNGVAIIYSGHHGWSKTSMWLSQYDNQNSRIDDEIPNTTLPPSLAFCRCFVHVHIRT